MMRKHTARRRADRLLLCAVTSLLLAAATLLAPADAGASGRVRMTPGRMTKFAFTLRANTDYEIIVENENAIVTLVTYPEGNFVAGSGDATFGFLVPRATAARNVFMIIRGRPGTPDGTANFLIRGFQGSNTTYTVAGASAFTATTAQSVASLAAGTQITTVEDNQGVTDTALMVLDSTGRSVAFDDDDAIDKMSFVKLAAACTGGCQIIVGRLAGTGTATLVWDESLAAGDSDRDGLSNEFETNVTHTLTNNADTDGDAIRDGFEVYGAILAGSGRGGSGTPPPGGGKDGNLLKFPMYGADPLLPDVFVELDWAAGCPGGVTNCPAGSAVATKDGLKYSAGALDTAFNAMATAGIRAHFDAAVPTAAGDAQTRFGDWGGARRLSDGDTTFSSQGSRITEAYIGDKFFGGVDCNLGATGARFGFFHHYISVSSRPRSPFGGCGTALPDGGTFTHEIGHNFNLRHGGPANAADNNVNCKVNYPSVMSYPNQFINGFADGYSRGRFLSVPVNGFTMSEVTGLNTADANVLNEFNTGSFARGFLNTASFPTGIDWNMDGRIDSGTVRAPTNWSNTTCAAPYMRANWNLVQATAATFPTRTVAEASAASPEMFSVGVARTSGAGQILIGSGDTTNCTSQASQSTCTRWTQRSTIPGAVVQSGVAVAGPMLVFRSNGHIAARRLVPLPSTTPPPIGTRVPIAAAQQATILGGPTITSDPAAVEVNGVVKVYAISGGRLMRWEFDEGLNAWVRQGTPEVWEDGTPVNTTLGVAVVHGADQTSGLGVYAAIPNTNGVMPNNPFPIELARLVSTPVNVSILGFTFTTTSDRWQRFSFTAGSVPMTQLAKPGLAYVPFNLSAPVDGRFYLTGVGADRIARIAFTEGNNPAAGSTSRRLIWKPAQQTSFTDADNQARAIPGGVTLGRFGASVVGAAFIGLSTTYFPAVDGIYNLTYRDIDERSFIRGNLRCSLSDCD
jgi:hypothetical protein